MLAAQGKITNFGSAPYQNNPDNQQSFFIEIENEQSGNQTMWGIGIKDAIQSGDFEKGDEIVLYDDGIPEGSRKRNWSMDSYERPVDHTNAIESGVSPQVSKDASTQNIASKSPSNVTHNIEDEVDYDLPSNIKNNYILKIRNRALGDEKINFYEREGDESVIAFEDRSKSLNTSREDSKTIKAMVDVAQSKGWSSLKLKGTQEFKREAWLEANVRGIETQGYKPTEQDLVELEKRQQDRTINSVGNNEARTKEINASNAKIAAATVVAHSEVVESVPSSKIEDLDENDGWEEQKIQSFLNEAPQLDSQKIIEQEALVRANEFDAGRDINPNSDVEVEAEVEHFHENLAVPTGIQGMSNREAMQKVESSFDKKINPSQRNEVKEAEEQNIEEKLSNKDKLAVEAWRRVVDERFKDNPAMLEQKHEELNAKIPDIAAGKIELPQPTQKVQPDVDINPVSKGSPDRGR